MKPANLVVDELRACRDALTTTTRERDQSVARELDGWTHAKDVEAALWAEEAKVGRLEEALRAIAEGRWPLDTTAREFARAALGGEGQHGKNDQVRAQD